MDLRHTNWQDQPSTHRQARSDTKPASQYRCLRNAAMWVNRHRNRRSCLPDNDEGRDFFVVLRAWALPDKEVGNTAPWLREAPEELRKLDKRAKHFKPTPDNVAKLLKVTEAEWRAYAAGAKPGKRRSLPIRHENWDEHLREVEARRNARRKKKRAEEQAALLTQCRDPREVAVVEAMLRISRQPGYHDWSVQNIMANVVIAGPHDETFPTTQTAFRVAVHRALDRLERRGLVETWGSKQPGKQGVRYGNLIPQKAVQSVRTANSTISRQKQTLSSVQLVARSKKRKKIWVVPQENVEDADRSAKGLAMSETVVTGEPSQPAPSQQQSVDLTMEEPVHQAARVWLLLPPSPCRARMAALEQRLKRMGALVVPEPSLPGKADNVVPLRRRVA